jgi:hypothetical protein
MFHCFGGPWFVAQGSIMCVEATLYLPNLAINRRLGLEGQGKVRPQICRGAGCPQRKYTEGDEILFQENLGVHDEISH